MRNQGTIYKIEVEYKKGEIGKEFFNFEKEMENRIAELEQFGNFTAVKGIATVEEVEEEHEKSRQKSFEYFKEQTKGMTEEEKFNFMLLGQSNHK